MKKTGYWKGFTSALVLVGLVTALGVTATAASKRTIEVEDGIKITINDAKFTPRDADGKKVPVFLYDGTTYVPVRAVCEAAGMDVSFDSKTRTVELTTPDWNLSEDPDADDYITRAEAKEIALDDAGVKASNAVFLKAELDWDDGRQVYELELRNGRMEYECDIDAKSGSILKWEADYDD